MMFIKLKMKSTASFVEAIGVAAGSLGMPFSTVALALVDKLRENGLLTVGAGENVVTQLDFVNPHVVVWFDVKGADGTTTKRAEFKWIKSRKAKPPEGEYQFEIIDQGTPETPEHAVHVPPVESVGALRALHLRFDRLDHRRHRGERREREHDERLDQGDQQHHARQHLPQARKAGAAVGFVRVLAQHAQHAPLLEQCAASNGCQTAWE